MLYFFLLYGFKMNKKINKKMISKKYKKVCMTLNYVEHSHVFTLPVTRFVSIFAFAILVGIPIG